MPKVTEVFAFVAEDTGPDDEGLAAMQVGNTFMPLVGADMKRVDSLRPHARAIARRMKKPIKLLRFTQREELEVIK